MPTTLNPDRTLFVPPMHTVILETPTLTRPPVVNDVLVMGLESGVAVILSASKTNHFVGHYDGDPVAAERALQAHLAKFDECTRRARLTVGAIASANQRLPLFGRLMEVVRARQPDLAISDWPGPAIAYDYRQCRPRSETPTSAMRITSPADQFRKCRTKARLIMTCASRTPAAQVSDFDARAQAPAPSLRSPTPYAHAYETEEVRALLRDAEGVASPVTRAPGHARSKHALRTPGGVGTTRPEMVDRTHKRDGESNNQAKKRGMVGATSAFSNIVMQAEAACQVLNSVIGQAALRNLDNPRNGGLPIRLSLNVRGVREAGALRATGNTRLHAATKERAGVLTLPDGAEGVTMIIDRAAGQARLHIQTCYGCETMEAESFKLDDMSIPGHPRTIAQG